LKQRLALPSLANMIRVLANGPEPQNEIAEGV
jgi:hypothetical protein